MNHESIYKQNRHTTEVKRVEERLKILTEEEIDKLIGERQQNVSLRWAKCHKDFKMLFMTLNRDNHRTLPQDVFDIKLKSEAVGDETIDTYARIRRNRRDDTFDVRPYTKNGRIEDHEFQGERFGDTYVYRYGSYYSKSATLSVDHDEFDPLIKLDRIDGYVVQNMDTKAKAIYLSAIDNLVDPVIEQTEDTLILLCAAMLDETLNPELAAKTQLPPHPPK